jgi:type III pantothenate kinase
MLLTVDIGNTDISLGLFKGRRLFKAFRLATRVGETVEGYYLELLKELKKARLGKTQIEAVVICSVVPGVLSPVRDAFRRLLGIRPLIVGKDLVVPIKNLYKRPGEVGQDRLINAFAGIKFYGAPIVIVDFGTAVTFDVVSRRGQYLGGIILPGLQLCLDVLFERTALLPKINLGQRPLRRRPGLIGTTTVESMLAGTFYGMGFLCDGLIGALKENLGKDTQVIATGGHARLAATFCKTIDKIDVGLTLKGLNSIFNKKRQKNAK